MKSSGLGLDGLLPKSFFVTPSTSSELIKHSGNSPFTAGIRFFS
jgi:hypothetical protein